MAGREDPADLGNSIEAALTRMVESLSGICPL